jgi:hypothetical protein
VCRLDANPEPFSIRNLIILGVWPSHGFWTQCTSDTKEHYKSTKDRHHQEIMSEKILGAPLRKQRESATPVRHLALGRRKKDMVVPKFLTTRLMVFNK